MNLLKGKKLLILGATSETSLLVKKAESLGVETFVADPYENAPAKQYSQNPVLVDCFDVDKICEIVINERIDGILPGCADILVPVYETVCEKLKKYCYVNKKLVETFNNKKGLKDILKKHKLNVINEYSKAEVESDSFDSFPVFVKPVDNNSSKGMYIATNRKDFESIYQKSLSFSRSKTVLIEEYKQCDDFLVGYFAENGIIKTAFTGDRFVIKQDGFGSITSCIVYPSQYQSLYFENTHSKMLEIFNELGFTNGICLIQGFVEDEKVMFYDPALRITGGQEYILLNQLYNADELEALISFAILGKTNGKVVSRLSGAFSGHYACNLTISVELCVIGKIMGTDHVFNSKNVLNVTQEHFEGDLIDKKGTAQQNVFRIHILADSREELRDSIKEVQSSIQILDSNGNNVVLTGFNADEWYKKTEN